MQGITFKRLGDPVGKNTLTDWGLIIDTNPTIEPPEPKLTTVEIPAADGVVDLTNTVSKYTHFNNRKMTITCGLMTRGNRWLAMYSEVANYLHGQQVDIFLEGDDDYFWRGRATINSWQSSELASTIVIDADVEPYKLERYSSIEEWLWDPFNFRTGVIRRYKDIQVKNGQTVHVMGTRKPVVPVFYLVSGTASLKRTKSTVALSKNGTRIIDVIVDENGADFTFSVSGTSATISIELRGGSL